MKMTSLLMIILLCIQCAVMVASEGGPRVFKVGDEFQWKVPLQNDTSVYSRWASTNRFHIGDSLCECTCFLIFVTFLYFFGDIY